MHLVECLNSLSGRNDYLSIIDEVLVFGIIASANHEDNGVLIGSSTLRSRGTAPFARFQQFRIEIAKIVRVRRRFQFHQMVNDASHGQILDVWQRDVSIITTIQTTRSTNSIDRKKLATHVFLDDQVFHALHNETGSLRHELGEHVDRSSSTARVLARTSNKFRARSKIAKKRHVLFGC